MKKAIAAVGAVVVVAIFIFKGFLPIENLNSPLLSYIGLKENPEEVRDSAWQTFAQYRSYAEASDIEGVKTLSHQVSATCQNEATLEECKELMNSVFLFTSDWDKEEFPQVFFDDKQIVLSTGAAVVGENGEKAMTSIIYTRTSDGTPKVLGIKFCVGEEASSPEKCVNTNPSTRDTNKNGWWDDIEARFYR